MKIVFISHDGNYNGGAQKCLVDLLKGLKLNYPHIQIYVIFPEEGSLVTACLPYIAGYKVIDMLWWLLPGHKSNNFRQKLKFLRKAKKTVSRIICYLREVNPDYGVTNTIVIPYLAVACKILGLKHNWFIHEVPNDTWNDNSFLFSNANIQRWINFLSHKILVTSNYAKSYYRQTIPDNKLIVIDQAVELNIPASVCVPRHSRYTILLVGAFDSNKGQLELLKAVNKIVAEGRDIYCYLVGADLGFMDECKEYLVLKGLEKNVMITPFSEEVWRYYYKSDVLVVCSTLETFGRVAVEAQKCGLPVILSNVGANPERIMNKVNGLLYQKGNLIDLISKIEYLRDSNTRKEFSRESVFLNLNKYNIAKFALDFIETF